MKKSVEQLIVIMSPSLRSKTGVIIQFGAELDHDVALRAPRDDRKKSPLLFFLLAILISTPAYAAQEQVLELPKLIESNGAALVEPSPAKEEVKINPNIRLVSIKNEFYESLKIVLEAKDPSAEIKTKEIYLNPYQVLTEVSISKNIDYSIKVYNLENRYLGFMLNTDTKVSPSIHISPFLLVQDQKKQTFPVVIPPSAEQKKTETKATEPTVNKALPEPKEIKSNQKTPAALNINSNDKFLKVANLSEAHYKLNITLPSGEKLNKTWDIDNESYLPELLNLDSKPVSIKGDYKITITDKKTKEETSKTVNQLALDETGNYVWIIGETNSDSK